jgi:hypothetical protein
MLQEEEPELSIGYIISVVAELLLGRPEHAAQFVSRALESPPQTVDLDLASFCWYLGMRAKAKESLRLCYGSGQRQWPAPVAGLLLGEAKDCNGLATTMREQAQAHFWQGYLCLEGGDRDGAVTQFQQCLAHPSASLLRYEHFLARFELGRMGHHWTEPGPSHLETPSVPPPSWQSIGASPENHDDFLWAFCAAAARRYQFKEFQVLSGDRLVVVAGLHPSRYAGSTWQPGANVAQLTPTSKGG